MNKRRTATVVGYHGRRNLGDDIFLRVASQWLVEKCGVQRIFVAGKRSAIPSSLFGAQIVPFEREREWVARLVWLRIFRHALMGDILLFAAGSIFTIQPFFLAWLVLRCIRLLKGDRVRIIALGVSVGPLSDAFSRLWCARLFDLMDRVVLRDAESARLLSSRLGTTAVDISYDLALAWEPVWRLRPAEVPTGHFRIGMALHPAAWPALDGHLKLDRIIPILDALEDVARHTRSIEVIVFASCTDIEDGDTELSNWITDQLVKRGLLARAREYDGDDLESFAAHLHSCRAIITSRMHAGIVAMMGAVPTLQIEYARKVGDFFAQCGLDTGFLLSPDNISAGDVERFLKAALRGGLERAGSLMRDQLSSRRQAIVGTMNRLAEHTCEGV